MEPLTKQKKNLSNEEAQVLLSDLLDGSSFHNGKRVLATSAVKAAAKKFKMSERNIRRRWATALKSREEKGYYSSASSKKDNGRKQLYDREALQEAMEEIPSYERGNLRSLANALGVSVKVVWKIKMNEKVIHPHSNSIKPFLTDENKLHRLAYAADHVIDVDGEKKWSGMYEEIHVDEKWFFISQETQKVYLTSNEKENNLVPNRKCKSKRYLIKVMFLCAVARPRFNDNGQCLFDGKIGCWPFIQRVQAQKTSKNRPAGTWETKNIAVTKDAYIDFIVNKVIPAAIAKWPRNRSLRTQRILIQQDNPNTHGLHNDAKWLDAKERDARFKFSIKNQPPNSPDTNILDLGFFRSLQSLQWSLPPAQDIDSLVAQVGNAWSLYDPKKLNRIFLSHQMVCQCILESEDGDNDFPLPHVNKDQMEREGRLPKSLPVSARALSVIGTL